MLNLRSCTRDMSHWRRASMSRFLIVQRGVTGFVTWSKVIFPRLQKRVSLTDEELWKQNKNPDYLLEMLVVPLWSPFPAASSHLLIEVTYFPGRCFTRSLSPHLLFCLGTCLHEESIKDIKYGNAQWRLMTYWHWGQPNDFHPHLRFFFSFSVFSKSLSRTLWMELSTKGWCSTGMFQTVVTPATVYSELSVL